MSTALRPAATVDWAGVGPVSAALTLAMLRRGPGDPTFRADSSSTIWRTTRQPSGPATYRIRQQSSATVTCDVWGPGAADVVASFDDLLGARDDHAAFEPRLPVLAEAHRRLAGLRTPRTGRVLEALIPAVLEQRVQTIDAHAAWRRLLLAHGEPAPGPAPAGMRVPPSPAGWLAIASWDWQRAGIDPGRARTARACADVAARLEECADMPADAAARRLTAIPGVGAWTAAEVAQRALGDSDAVSVGDFHLARQVGLALVGKPVDDAAMLELLAPWAPHRYRVVRLLTVTGMGTRPRRAPRFPRQRPNNW